ncbi:hypothetical protein [Tsuneonella amylolytica]|uniref:hypothetical protein n=1 Tax=Tsuneonella amylolytica TaxID=2338327 RepID=UPI000EA8BCC5|nr:hypothetical protein [Tsuneonella amylolytica]
MTTDFPPHAAYDPDGDRPRGIFAAFDARWPEVRRRFVGMALALALESFLLLLLLTLGQGITGSREGAESLTSVTFAPDTPPAPEVEPQPERETRPSPLDPVQQPPRPPVERQPSALPVPVPAPRPMPTPAATLPVATSTPAAPAAAVPGRIAARLRDDVSGPAGGSRASSSGDSQIVGSGPRGEPVYAARWYREPSQQDLRGYLSTVDQPGWATINCRTAPAWRVEDCYLLDEYPDPGTLGRAVLAAAWQFQVRPPVKGGKSLVGEWVRIRITYEARRAP